MTDRDDLPLFPESLPWEEAQAKLAGLDLGDGLPLVPPTLGRFDAMVSGRGATGRSFGHVLPLMGDLTLEAVAYNCILAGCLPSELPVVLTAVEAALEEEFNLLGVSSTTGTAAVAVCVHGPIVSALGMNAGGNILGPGNRANACIGRAVSLIMRNVGGARAGIGDMATMGQPGKYTFCFAEGAHRAFPPLPVRRGFGGDESSVTVMGVSGTAEVLPADPGDTPELVLQPVAAAMNAAVDVTGAKRPRERGEQVFLLPPEMADRISAGGWNLRRVQDYLFEAHRPHAFDGMRVPDDRPIARTPEDIHPIVTGGAGVKMTHLPLWSGGSRTVTRRVRKLGG
ncbi:MAG: hypothetical protein ACREF6_19765 [Alphaproteobacteria bacterium]